MQTAIINRYRLKSICVVKNCNKYIGLKWSNYYTRGNFCPECNANADRRVKKK